MMPHKKKNGYYFNPSWRVISFFSILWIVVYLEPVTVGPFKVSQLWKALVVGFLLIKIAKRKIPTFSIVGILFAFKFLLYSHLPYGYMMAIQDCLEALVFPLFLAFFLQKISQKKITPQSLIDIAIYMSLFLIYSTVPFLFGLESLNPVTELDRYGLESTAMKGLFYQIATASKLFTLSTIILVNARRRFSNNFINKTIWGTAVLLGTYFVYTSWTRTGWFIFVVVLIFSLFYKSQLKKKLIAVFITMGLLAIISHVYATSEAFRWRVTGGSTYRDNTELSVESIARSRVPFIVVALSNMKDEGPTGIVLGYGTATGKDHFKRKTGMAIVSHNRTFEILESSGIIALILYLIFIWKLYSKVSRSWKTCSLPLKKLSVVSCILFVGFFLSSHGTPIWGEFIYACIFSATIWEFKHKRQNYESN